MYFLLCKINSRRTTGIWSYGMLFSWPRLSLPLSPTINVVAESVIKNNTGIGISTFIRTSFAYLAGKISDNLPDPGRKKMT